MTRNLNNQANAKKTVQKLQAAYANKTRIESPSLGKAQLREEAERALDEWRNRSPNKRIGTLDDVLRRKY